MILREARTAKSAGLSAKQRGIVEDIKAHGGVLERRKSGHWTYPGCAGSGRLKFGEPVPARHWSWSTVSSLIDAGLLHVTASSATRSAIRVTMDPMTATAVAEGRLRLVA